MGEPAPSAAAAVVVVAARREEHRREHDRPSIAQELAWIAGFRAAQRGERA